VGWTGTPDRQGGINLTLYLYVDYLLLVLIFEEIFLTSKRQQPQITNLVFAERAFQQCAQMSENKLYITYGKKM
jgi:hypothetical protein